MIYANHVTKEMFVFDKNGQWNDQGINHKSLSMDATYNETNWYDEFSANNFWSTSSPPFAEVSC